MATVAAPSRKRSLPPGPPARHPAANVRPFLRNRAEFLLNIARTYGDITYFKLGWFDIYFVNDPKYVQEILVTKNDCFKRSASARFVAFVLGDGLLTTDGAFHKRQRRIIQPVFHRQRIVQYGECMTRHARQLSERWQAGSTVDMDREMMRLTLGIVAETLFTTRTEKEAHIVENSLEAFLSLVDRIANPAGMLLNKLPLPSNRRFKKALADMDALIYGLMNERRNDSDAPDDLLTRLMNARDEETGEAMSDKQVRDEVLTLFLAGHETTSLWLTWTWLLLAEHRDVAEKLHSELDSVLGGRVPTTQDLTSLPYTQQILKESLRIYPPAYLLDREAVVDFPVGDFVIPKGAMAMMSPYAMHHHPAYWPEPERFNPDRWADDDPSRPRFAYFPFGGGPHVCVGEGFAWMEAALILAELAQRWKPVRASKGPVETDPVITMRPKGRLPMTLQPR